MLKNVYPNCAGLDVHKKFVSVCRLTVDAHGETQAEVREFSTMTDDLEALAAWLTAGGVTHVAMESTGVYWHPIYNILEGRFELFLVNAQAIKRMPGRKTDIKDAEWIATLMQHGLLQRSLIPDKARRELRDLTRYRQSLVEERSRFANRLQKVLEGTNLKLAAVATDIQGVSAQAILRAMLAGQTDAHALAELSRGRLRAKRAELERALQGQISAHQRFMLTDLLVHLDFLDERIATVEAEIETKLASMPPFETAVQLLDTIPGVNRMGAVTIVAEIGIDMSRFPSDRHLTAWAGVAPGNDETGGKQRSGKTRKANKYLRRALVLAAHGAARTKNTYLKAQYYRLKARRGAGKAAMAVGRTILQMAYFMLQRGEAYRELGANYFDQLDKVRTAKRLIKRLELMGFSVQVAERPPLQPIAQVASLASPPTPLAT